MKAQATSRSARPAAARPLEGSARERLLAAATELFYAEGVHTVGIERVIERAGVAKASLYSTFGSKEALVRAYLEARAADRRERVAARLARHEDPRARLLEIFDYLAERAAEPDFRGCAFVNANAEGPREEGAAAEVTADMRAWQRELFTSLARACGASEPTSLGRRLCVLYDGASVAASLDRDPRAAREARAVAEVLLDAHLAAAPRPRRV
ncbi:MAG TPA: helix-turn-helix domain-containing protein [Polyangia bacterium]|nr:helix-turn-helix domain-containing protein [Polyangia bacterium]